MLDRSASLGCTRSASAMLPRRTALRLGIGTTTIGSRLVIQGSTADNTANALQVNNSSGTGLVTVRNDGNVGIGNVSPSASLDIKAAANVNPFNVASSSGTSELVVTSQGNVGIGTTGPNNKLEISGAAVATPPLRLGTVNSSAYYWDIGRENATTGDFVFNNANGGSSTEKVRITVDGNVGQPSAWSLHSASGRDVIQLQRGCFSFWEGG